MAYTDVISLSEAKDYLGVDDTSRDAEITRIITSALKYIEKRTNVLVDERNKVYDLIDGVVKVYDAPINTLDVNLSATVSRIKRPLYSIYVETDDNQETLTLSVGSSNVDEDLKEAGYMLIEHYFGEGERMAIPKAVEDIINANRRFIL